MDFGAWFRKIPVLAVCVCLITACVPAEEPPGSETHEDFADLLQIADLHAFWKDFRSSFESDIDVELSRFFDFPLEVLDRSGRSTSIDQATFKARYEAEVFGHSDTRAFLAASRVRDLELLDTTYVFRLPEAGEASEKIREIVVARANSGDFIITRLHL